MAGCFQWCWPALAGPRDLAVPDSPGNDKKVGKTASTSVQRQPTTRLDAQRDSVRRKTASKGHISRGQKFNDDPEAAVVAISDPGQDLDDEMTYIMMRHLVEEGLLDLRGIITTLTSAFERARLCRGTLNLLGMPKVPVGIGSDGGDTEGKHTASPFEKGAKSYMPAENSEEAMRIKPGRRLLGHIYEQAGELSLTLLIVASVKDAALFLRDNEDLFVSKTKEVVIMGGVLTTSIEPDSQPLEHYEMTSGEHMKPDTSNNQTFDQAASDFFFRRCQQLGVRLVIVSRWAAYAAKMPRAMYDELAVSGSSIGRRLRNAQRESIESLWTRAASAADDKARAGLPARCDRKWFTETFCRRNDDPNRSAKTVWDLVDGFMQYDTMALLACMPTLRDRFYKPVYVTTYSEEDIATENLVIGITQKEPNLVEPNDDLMQLLNIGFKLGLSLNHHLKAQSLRAIAVLSANL